VGGAAGAAAVQLLPADIVRLVAPLPETAHLVQPAGSSFFLQAIAYHNHGPRPTTPRLLVGDWHFDMPGLEIPAGQAVQIDLSRSRMGYQMDPGERVTLTGHEGVGVILHGIRWKIPNEMRLAGQGPGQVSESEWAALEAVLQRRGQLDLQMYSYWLKV
jgi:hypothetical protein